MSGNLTTTDLSNGSALELKASFDTFANYPLWSLTLSSRTHIPRISPNVFRTRNARRDYQSAI